MLQLQEADNWKKQAATTWAAEFQNQNQNIHTEIENFILDDGSFTLNLF